MREIKCVRVQHFFKPQIEMIRCLFHVDQRRKPVSLHQTEFFRSVDDFHNQYFFFFIYRGSTFESSYGKRILEEEELSNEFKNEFWFICGAAFVNFNGIENQLAEFLVQNECKLTEGLLYKFTNLHIDSTLKMSLLSLAVKQKIIINLQAFKSYVQSINCEFAKLWTTPQKITVDDDTETRTVIDYMRKSNLVSFTARKGKLHLISAS